ncbi:MAG TPA: hypothetical protein VIK89_14205 [Cytophagaceae bacterium]
MNFKAIKKSLLIVLVSTMMVGMTAFVGKDKSESGTVSNSSEKKGVFSCFINDKPFVIEGVTASMRNITGGGKQLSLSNDRFIKFAFFNPIEKTINVTQKTKEAYIRYEDPATRQIAVPSGGFVTLTVLDEQNGLVSGTFELQMLMGEKGKEKLLKITNGKFENVPIVHK